MFNRLLHSIRQHPLVSFYILTFTFSWTFLLLAYRVFENSLFLAWIGLFFPALSALFVTGVCEGKAGLERLLARLYRWRAPWVWYLAIFGLPVVLVTGTILLHDGPANTLAWLKTLPSLAPFLVGMTLLMSIVITGEEIGWRGFALPHFQERFSPLASSLALGFLWGIWHVPAAMDPGNVLNRAPLPLSVTLFTLGTMGFSILYTWIWNHTGGSLLLVCLFHACYNNLNTLASAAYPYIIDEYWYYLAVLAVVVLAIGLFSGRGLRRPLRAPEAEPTR